MINHLDPPWVESQEIPSDPQNPHQTELAKAFENLEDHWQVVESRYFLSTGQRPTWDAVRHFVEDQLGVDGSYHISRRRPVRDAFRDFFNMLRDPARFRKVFDGGERFTIIIFSSGFINREYIAVAMDYEPIDGRWLLGYFSLKK